MNVTRFLYRVARTCGDHAWWVIAAWVVTLLLLTAANNAIPPAGQQDFELEGTDSAAALTLMQRAFPGTSSGSNPLVIGGSEELDTGAGLQTIKKVEHDVKQITGVAKVQGPQDNPDQYSPDKQTAIIQVTVQDRYAGKPDMAQEILDTARQAAPSNLVALGGFLGQSISNPDTHLSEGLGLLAAVIVLILTFRRLWAAAIPLISAIITVGIGSAIVALLGRVVLIPPEAPVLGTMLGLGVGIDYALFLVMRQRMMLARGFEPSDAAGRTAGTSGAGIVFAGTTLILAVCGLALTGIDFLAWLGYSAAIMVLVAVVVSATLVPAILGLLGKRILRKEHRDLFHENDDHLDRGMWARIADSVTGKPWRYTIIAVVILLVLAAPMLTMSFGMTDNSDLPPTTTAYQANEMMVEGFGPGSTGPLLIVSQMNKPATAPKNADAPSGVDPRTLDPRLVDLQKDLEDTAGIKSVSDVFVDPSGGVAVMTATPTTGPADPATETLINDLRDNVLPEATAGKDMESHVGGSTALMMDLTTVIGQRLPYFIIGVATLAALLLMLAYRSIWIPVKAAAMNIVSICAAYGVVVAVFEWGWGASLIGLDELVPIQTFIPMFMFAILFGLSMDYEVFLLTGFREHWERTGNMVTAVRRGLTDTGQVVTSAATIMVVVFLSFILVPDATVKMFGVGLATAVFVDATIVRCMLVPALMVLAAKWTWWLPKWLDRALPHLNVEGDPTALGDIEKKPEPYKPHDVAEATRPIVPMFGVVIAVALAWFIGVRMVPDSPSAPYASLSIAVAALAGGIITWLPRGTPGAGSRPGVRILMLLIGVLSVSILFLLLKVLIPFTDQNQGQIAAWSLLIIALIVAITPLRKVSLPFLLGGILITLSLAVGSSGITTDYGDMLQNALVPTFLAGFLALLIGRLTGHADDARDSADGPGSAEPSPSGSTAADAAPVKDQVGSST